MSQTVPRHPRVESRLYAACASGRTSIVVGAGRFMARSARPYVLDLRLDHVDHRAVAEAGVRAEQQEQVREAGRRTVPRYARWASRPRLGQQCGRRGRARGPRRDVGDVEAGPEDDRVDLALRHRPRRRPRVRRTSATASVTSSTFGCAARDTTRWTAGSACSPSCSPASTCARSSGSAICLLACACGPAARAAASARLLDEARARAARAPSRRRRGRPAGQRHGAGTASAPIA